MLPPFARIPPFDSLTGLIHVPPTSPDPDYMRVRHHDLEELWHPERLPHIAAAYTARMRINVDVALKMTTEGDTVLDVGCAQGTFGFILASHGRKVTLLDARKGHVDYARARYTGSNVRFEVGLLSTHCPRDQDYAFVSCTEVLEHVKEPSILLQSLRDKTRPGGAVFLTTPNADYAFCRLPSYGSAAQSVIDAAESNSADGEDHRYLFTREELISLVRGAGLRLHSHGFAVPFWVAGNLKMRYPYGWLQRSVGRVIVLGSDALGGHTLADRYLCSSQWVLAERPDGES